MSSSNTPLYQEAIIEVKKLRELAKKEAERSILEKFSPIVDKLINQEMSSVPVIFEQEEGDLPPVTTTAAPTDPNPVAQTPVPQMPATPPMDANVAPPTGDMGTSSIPPVEATPAADLTQPSSPKPEDASVPPISSSPEMGILVPGPDGKVTIDIDAVFAATPEGSEPNLAGSTLMSPTELPNPTNPVGPVATEPMPANAPPSIEPAPLPLAETFKNSLRALEKEVLSETSKNNSLNEKSKEILQNKILVLYELAQKAKASKDISKAIIANGEVRMEFIFSKLKESGKQDNSYNRQSTKTKEDSNMSKKEFQTLKEFAASLFAEEVEPKGHAGFGDGGHAAGDINNKTTLKDETPKKKSGDAGGVEDPGKADSLKVGGAAVAEAVDENAELEAELMEMLSGMEEEGMTAMSLPEETPPVAEGAAVKEALEKQLKALKEEEAKLTKALKECGMGMPAGGEPANVNIKITVDGGAVSDVETSGAPVGGDEGEEMIELVPDQDQEEEPMLGGEEEPASEEEEEEEETPPMVAESRVSKENKNLRSQLAETQLLTARALFVSKLFAEHNLSTGTKQKIVEYIDSAQTVEEAKTKYNRAKKMLEESTKQPTNRVGSSSKPGSSGGPVLTENVSPFMKLEMNPNRWMQLAGINKKSG